MITPAPPRRPCRRYGADGTACSNTTNRADGWCGRCDGYTTVTPAVTRDAPGPRRSEWRWGPGAWTPGTLGMDSDEAYEVDVTPGAVATYARVHSVVPQIAETQIRSLLEDLISEQATTERSGTGTWRIYFRKHGYGLVISADRSHVLRYCTRHAERTWAQYRTGVTSRISGSGGMAAWKREAVSGHVPLPIGGKALNLYARHTLGLKITRDTIDEIARRLAAHLAENVLPHWLRTEEAVIEDGHGNTWVLLRNERFPDGIIATVYATGSEPVKPPDRPE